jgi:hypothetical protein
LRRELERIEIPGEHDARERTWALVRAAHAEREPEPRRISSRPIAVALAAAALVAAIASPPGRSLVGAVREAVGVASADDALFSLPTRGRLLVTSDAGAWVVSPDGSKRLLGAYDDAAWSPFGRFVVVSGGDELATFEPDGDRRWSLARPAVGLPSWGGTRTDTRIAYVSHGQLRIVAGDGTGDVAVGPAAPMRPRWRQGGGFVVDYVGSDGEPRAYDAVSGSAVPARRARAGVLVRRAGARSEVVVDGRVRFSGTGSFVDATLSPDRRWVLVAWRDAGQWLFLSARGTRRVRAVANVARQFDSVSFPRVRGWCCS